MLCRSCQLRLKILKIYSTKELGLNFYYFGWILEIMTFVAELLKSFNFFWTKFNVISKFCRQFSNVIPIHAVFLISPNYSYGLSLYILGWVPKYLWLSFGDFVCGLVGYQLVFDFSEAWYQNVGQWKTFYVPNLLICEILTMIFWQRAWYRDIEQTKFSNFNETNVACRMSLSVESWVLLILKCFHVNYQTSKYCMRKIAAF